MLLKRAMAGAPCIRTAEVERNLEPTEWMPCPAQSLLRRRVRRETQLARPANARIIAAGGQITTISLASMAPRCHLSFMNRIAKTLNIPIVLLGLLALLDGFVPLRTVAGLWTGGEQAVLLGADDRHAMVAADPSDGTPPAILPSGPVVGCPQIHGGAGPFARFSGVPHESPQGWPEPRAPPVLS